MVSLVNGKISKSVTRSGEGARGKKDSFKKQSFFTFSLIPLREAGGFKLSLVSHSFSWGFFFSFFSKLCSNRKPWNDGFFSFLFFFSFLLLFYNAFYFTLQMQRERERERGEKTCNT